MRIGVLAWLMMLLIIALLIKWMTNGNECHMECQSSNLSHRIPLVSFAQSQIQFLVETSEKFKIIFSATYNDKMTLKTL